MKHFFSVAFFFLLFSISELTAQTTAKNALWLAPACKPKTYGLQNSKGEVATEAKFDMLEEGDGKGWIAFSGGKYGVINSSGSWIIRPNFEIIVQFLNGKAIAGKKMKAKKAAAPQYIYDMYSETSSDSIFYFGVVDASGTWVVDATYEFLRLSEDGSIQYADANRKFGFLNADGSVMIRAKYSFASRMQSGVAVIGESSGADAMPYMYNQRIQAEKYYVIDRNGNKLNTDAYELLREYKDGRAVFNKGGLWKRSRYSSEAVLTGGKWGYLDASGKEVITPVYDYAYDFVNGKAKVRTGQRILWIDKDGKETTPPLPDKNENAFTIFCQPGFFGYIGLDGKYVIAPQYFVAKDFSEELAAVMPLRASDLDCNNLPGANSEEYVISHRGYSRMLNNLLNLDRDYGIDFNNQPDDLKRADSTRMADSLTANYTGARRLYGYADKTGNLVLPAKYEAALPFHSGRAYVLFREKWGVIDTKGSWIFAPVLDWPGEASFIRMNYDATGKTYYNYYLEINYSGNFFYSFSEGIGCIYKFGQYGFIDSTGKIISAPVYDEVRPFVNGLAAVRHGKYWGFIDKTGKEAIPLRFKYAASFTKEGLAIASATPKHSDNQETNLAMEYEEDEVLYYGYIDKKGNWAIKPQFTEVGDFSEGLAIASLNFEKYGYIDKTGKFIIAPKYDDAGDFQSGLAQVRINMFPPVYIDKTGKVNKKYSELHPPKLMTAPLYEKVGSNNYWGFLNEKDELIIPYEFSEVGNFAKVE
ncbi:MAG: WG repeat-containing protein [Bacteroidia bacterium]